MPNVSAPFGFLPSWHPSGIIRPTAYVSSNATDLLRLSGSTLGIFKGQPVILSIGSGGAIDGATAATGRMVVRPWTANSDKLHGVFAGIEYVDSTGKPWVNDYCPAGQTFMAGARQVVYIWDDPEIIYRAQMDAAPAVGAYGLCGKQLNGVNFADGSTQTGLSGAMLSATAPATNSQGQFRVIKLANGVDNTSSDTYPIYEVKIQYSLYVTNVVSL